MLALVGPLGAGKTTFVQGVARGLGVPPDRHVASPTFALVNEHPGRVPLVHADLYRVADARELEELGLTDAFDRAAVAIEWLDRFPDAAPAERLEIAIAIGADGTRELTFRAHGDRAAALVNALGPDSGSRPRASESVPSGRDSPDAIRQSSAPRRRLAAGAARQRSSSLTPRPRERERSAPVRCRERVRTRHPREPSADVGRASRLASPGTPSRQTRSPAQAHRGQIDDPDTSPAKRGEGRHR